MVPVLATGKALINAAIGSEQQSLTDRWLRRFIFILGSRRPWRRNRPGLYCQRVTIGMEFLRKILPEVLTAVVGDEYREPEHIDALIVSRVDADLAEVERPRIDCARSRPFFTSIFRAKDPTAFASQIRQLTGAAFIALDYRHYHLRVRGADRQADASRLHR